MAERKVEKPEMKETKIVALPNNPWKEVACTMTIQFNTRISYGKVERELLEQKIVATPADIEYTGSQGY